MAVAFPLSLVMINRKQVEVKAPQVASLLAQSVIHCHINNDRRISTMIEIVQATSPSHIQTIRDLFREYEAFLQVDLCFQRFEEELANLPGKYAPPLGALLLASAAGLAAGCVAMRPLAQGVCEMKRLYVHPLYLGRGLGKKLARRVIERARAAGYARMRLDTLEKLQPALSLYTGLGFQKCAPYYENPLPGVVYMERAL
jgi:GNAT superfamily N-acetyltransferase